MRLNFLFSLVFLFVLLVNTSGAADYGPITMREDANITLDGGYLISESPANYSNLLFYGAIGDGVTDDTNALKWAIANNTVTTFQPGATYKVTAAIDPADWTGKTVIAYGSTIVLGADITLINVSDRNMTWLGGVVKTNSAYAQPVMKFSAGHDYANIDGVRIHDENVDGQLDGDWEGIKITGSGHHSEFRNIQIYGAKIGLNGTAEGSSWINAARFTDLDFISCNQSFKLVGANGNDISNLGVIYRLQTPGYGIILDNSDFNTFVGYENWWDGNLLSTFEAVQTTATANGNRFIGGHFEGSIHDHGGIILDSVRSYIMRSGIDGTNAGIMSNTGTYNYLLNGNLETNANNWTASDATATRNTDNYKIGQASLKLVGDGGGDHYAYQHVLPQNHSREFLTLGAWVFGNSTNT